MSFSLVTFLIIGLTVAISAFVQGSTGMGFALISAPVLALIEPRLIPVMLLILMVPLNFYIGWRERIGITWRAVKWVSVGRFAGTFLGLWILLVVNLHQLVLVIGWSTLIAAVAALLAPAFNPNRSALGVAGLVTGGVPRPPQGLAARL